MTNINKVLIKTPQFKRGLKSVLEARLIQGDLGILLAGEPAFEIDTGQLKIGNGKDAYKDLPYVGGISEEYLIKINQNAEDIEDIKGRLDSIEAINHHEHENKSELDKIIEGDVAKWNSLKNYDDSEIKNLINTKANSDDVAAVLAGKVDNSTLDSYYTKDETASLIKVNTDAIAILNGEGDGSIAKQIAEAIAKVVANAPEEFDTLKEIADYIASDKTGAADLLVKVVANETAIEAIEKAYKDKDAELIAEDERLANLIQSNINAIAILNGDAEGSVNKKIVDAINKIPAATEDALGLVKVGKTLKIDEDGKLNVSEVSTDSLVEGEKELVLIGGSAGYSVN